MNDAIQPFQADGTCSAPLGNNTCGVTIFTVPTGKRAVIEYFSGSASLPTGLVLSPGLTTVIGGQKQGHKVPDPSPAFPNGPPGSGHTDWGQQVHLYADSGTAIEGVALIQNNASAGFIVLWTISGYLVDVPFAP